MKLIRETQKILDNKTIAVIATLVRITPAVITLQNNPDINLYSMPIYASGKSGVFEGRIRRDNS